MKTAELVYKGLAKRVKQNLHPKGFSDSYNLLREYLFASKQLHSKVHWICDSAPGQGKTTALIEVMKSINSNKDTTPFLLVFNNKDALENVFSEIENYAIEHNRYKFVQYINENNVSNVYEEIDQYQILCITQQRLRDLSLGFGNKEKYQWYNSPSNSWLSRTLIIDEMPIFINETQFNISSNDNCVKWFDELAKESGLEYSDLQSGRSLIMALFNNEMESEKCQTQRLVKMIEGTKEEKELTEILNKINVENATRENVLKLCWFKKLLHKDGFGVIERTDYGNRILCAERIDYRNFGNILILDGTSGITPSVYNGEYEYIKIQNYHNYERVILHNQVIGTSKNHRKNPDTKQRIAEDIFSIRKDMEVFPLMAKGDVISYRKNQVITSDQSNYFDDYSDYLDDDKSDAVSLSLFNTVGKNILNNYSTLALLNLPIRHHTYYKKIAISIYGTEIDISINDGNYDSWFVDERVQKIFEELVLADLVQIIHRCKLRNINDSTPVHIYLYTKQTRWIDTLKTHFSLPDKNMRKTTIQDSYHDRFITICNEWAEISLNHCLSDKYDHIFGMSYTATQIGGRPFKDWLNKAWLNEERRNLIVNIFKENGLLFEEDSNKYKKIFKSVVRKVS
ncbi:DEAD/DEAH box helicase [Paenibacillus sp. Soil522]|uniref:DEAD/DEAH box helicase n=1 Tax=Paenibacillus sp. Soil522 TaxID=1736388 RepID=UPI0006F4713F|nr:DEAD/DEAH box helicase [Paenibacillus sp. Soil522]KRE29655.1 hypothetical protein ASG81_25480 [Paenibacillus sp. Soil522]